MDTTASDIRFDADGICNYCTEFLTKSSHILFQDDLERERAKQDFVAKVKASGRRKAYDCIVGVSGGVDSSWALCQAVQLGLRPLAVHMDNGWDSELAQHNIENLVRKLGVDLHTHVIDWDEYRALQQAFFDADVIDIELLYDNAMRAVNYQQAARQRVKYILAGTNESTEGMRMPPTWNWRKYDKKNIYAVWRRFGDDRRLRTFPAIGTIGLVFSRCVRCIRWVSFLNFIDYNKQAALQVLQRDFGYRPYPYKHYESVFTRFYQGYLLPVKFGIDKRRLHLSTLIASRQITRAEALRTLEQIPYPSQQDLEQDKRYFLKKMGWPRDQLEAYLARPEHPHAMYGSEKRLADLMLRTYRFAQETRSRLPRKQCIAANKESRTKRESGHVTDGSSRDDDLGARSSV